MPNPEGYRKALRLFFNAEKFKMPIITFIDTQGAFPGLEAEERGQAEAIARNIFELSDMKVPIIVVVIGEGGSGGALALGVGNRILMLENACYSVITPEGCASILWHSAEKAEVSLEQASMAAEALNLTAQDLKRLNLIDEVVPEPTGGAHSNHKEAAELLRAAIVRNLEPLCKLSPGDLAAQRYEKFRRMGAFSEG
jgi:acetyl-CoA carboxylase carboxyl transferase subunit alpha